MSLFNTLLSSGRKNELRAFLKRTFELPARGWSSTPHTLPHETIVTLTSYPGRFSTLAPTLECLLKQSIKPDRVILWIGKNDKDKLPEDVKRLAKPNNEHGFELKFREDLLSYTKIIHALREYPEAILVTADDDFYYHRNWLRELIDGWDSNNKTIICARGHGVRLDENGLPLSYRKWAWQVQGPVKSESIFPTTGYGALYPPGSLSPETTDQDIFLSLAPKADDVWLYFMALQAGSTFFKISQTPPNINWPGSQQESLTEFNVRGGGNDQFIQNMIEHYGWPSTIQGWQAANQTYLDTKQGSSLGKKYPYP
jgi:protein O-GlcNAc transferase